MSGSFKKIFFASVAAAVLYQLFSSILLDVHVFNHLSRLKYSTYFFELLLFDFFVLNESYEPFIFTALLLSPWKSLIPAVWPPG